MGVPLSDQHAYISVFQFMSKLLLSANWAKKGKNEEK